MDISDRVRDHGPRAYGDPDVWAIQPNMTGDPGCISNWGGSMGSADPGSPVLPNPTFPKICVGHSMTIQLLVDSVRRFGNLWGKRNFFQHCKKRAAVDSG